MAHPEVGGHGGAGFSGSRQAEMRMRGWMQGRMQGQVGRVRERA